MEVNGASVEANATRIVGAQEIWETKDKIPRES